MVVEVLLPLAAVVVAFTATYFCCIRPMRRGTCAMGGAPQHMDERAERLEQELRAAREELAELKQHQAHSTDTAPST
ncbi:hypothetical protein CDO52_02665 [Nocardiopsis gilva YIM 90087]|uniref:Uncharacterized protein n=1 Tax=Nocardiopsis gilva YIM 90087 TaxID=1235441 RepID=A0A223S113_9ACTN|nr:hypothetical protein CDO52_02665 [Nocardiopsis gilva YIM 90087]